MKKFSLIILLMLGGSASANPPGTFQPLLLSTGYTTTAISFNGASSVVSKAADLTGNVDGKKGISLIWFKLSGGNSALQVFLEQKVAGSFSSNRQASNIVRIVDAYTSTATNILRDDTTATYLSSATWHSLLCSWDLSIPTNACYMDDVAAPVASPLTNATIKYTGNGWNFGARDSSSAWLNGCLSDVYINFLQYLDLSVTANRRLFVSSTNKPVSLGATGSTPTGSQPIIFMSGTSLTWNTNLGSGGSFTSTNVTDCSTSPSN